MAEKKRPKIGLVFSGGGARGMAHVGVLSVLVDAGIPVDVVAGTSAGSLIGAGFAAGMDIQEINKVSRLLKWRNMSKMALARDGIFSFQPIENWVYSFYGELQFSDLEKPFAAVTTDLDTGDAVYLTEGSVARAIRASCSVPGVAIPTLIQGRRLVDGGLSNNLPVRAAKMLGAEFVIGVDVMRPHLNKKAGPLGIGFLSLLRLVERSGGGTEEADFLICPHSDSLRTLVDLGTREKMIALGEQETRKRLPALLDALHL